jgi:LuxR family transcriptional regulator, maltose regulon positive regulatory protein
VSRAAEAAPSTWVGAPGGPHLIPGGGRRLVPPDGTVPVMVRIPGSKIAVPDLPPWSVPRPRLWPDREDLGADQLVAVVAPAGAGKTTLLAEWARRDPHRRTAWVRVDPDDADPRRLWAAVLAAVVTAAAVPADSAPARLLVRLDAGPGGDGRDVGDGGDLTDEILDVLDDVRPAVRLVLDDVHHLAGSRAGVGVLTRLLRRSPAGVRLVVAARSDPPLGMPRLRVEGRLVEVRAEQLRFTTDDAAALLAASEVRLAPADLAVLHRRTEGWAAGLRLAAIALRAGADTRGVLARFSGDERSVADYLVGEVLAALPAATRTLLQEASVCDHLPAALAGALTGRVDAAHALEELVRAGALVERVAPAEYRLHGLLRSHLTADLARHRPARYRELHATAAGWWTDRQETAHALRHAERADDPALSAAILRRAGVPLLLAGDVPLLRHALAVVGPRRRQEDPRLALTAALADLESGDVDAAAAELARARDAWPARPDRSLEALRAGAELFAAGRGATPGPAGYRAPEPAEPELAALVHAGRAAAVLRGGNPAEALEETGQVLALARQQGFAALEAAALTLRAAALCGDGDLRAVVAAADEARTVTARAGRPRSGWTARAAAVAAYADLLRGDHERARARCAEALEGGESPVPETAPETLYALHVVHGTARGDGGGRDERTAGLAEARDARAALGAAPLPSGLASALAVLEHRAALRLGDHRAAGEVLAWLAGRVGETADVVLLRAWAEAAAGRPGSARTLAAPLRAAGCRGHRLVELDLLDAEAALSDGDDAAGRAALAAAVVRARGFDLVRPFGDAGPRSRAALLARGGTSTPRSPHEERVAAACATVPADAAPLSEREMVVLALLPSLLNAPAMAEELIVSVNTVKTQIRSIYAKLGVSTRREAVSRAHERGLFL